MKFNPLISVVVPVYNGADYVGEAIETILSQTYREFEIIVVNDGSTDDGATQRAIEPYLDRVKYLEQANGGVAAALNTGIENMTGDYFAWLSHDDLFLPNKLESQVTILNDLIDKKVVIYSDYAIVNFQKEHMYDVILDAYMLKSSSNHMPVLRGCLNGCTMLIHRKIFESCGSFKTDLRHTQDYDMWERMCWDFPMIHQAEVTVHQRVHDAQDSKRWDAIPECDALWINIIKKRDVETREEISGSSLAFLEGMKIFLSQTPYTGAQRFVENEIKELTKPKVHIENDTLLASNSVDNIEEGPGSVSLTFDNSPHNLSELSIILNHNTSYENALRSIHALAAIEYDDFEIIFLQDTSSEAERLGAELSKLSNKVRIIGHEGDLSNGRQKAVNDAQQNYVQFLTTRDVVVLDGLLSQFNEAKQLGLGACYAPYLSICEDISEHAVTVPSHWLGTLSKHDIVARNAVNISTVIFQRQVFSSDIKPPNGSVLDEVLFLLKIREHFTIQATHNVSILSYTDQSSCPVNLTHALDIITSLIKRLETDSSLRVEAKTIDVLKEQNAELFSMRLGNEKTGIDVSYQMPVRQAYIGDMDTDLVLGKFGLFDITKSDGIG